MGNVARRATADNVVPFRRPDQGQGPQLDNRDLPKAGQQTPGWVLNMRMLALEFNRTFHARALDDLGFLDGDGQWTSEERAVLEDQGRPDWVDNQIAPMMELVDGLERERNIITKFNGRTPLDQNGASVTNYLFDYVWDRNDASEHFWEAVQWSRKFGVGLLRVIRNPQRGEEPILIEQRDPRYSLLDPAWVRAGAIDAQRNMSFVGEDVWMPLREAVRRWPAARKKLPAMAEFMRSRLSNVEVGVHVDPFTSRDDAVQGLVAVPPIEKWDNNFGLDTINIEAEEVCVTTIQYRSYVRTWWLEDNGQEEELTMPPGVDEDQALEMLAQFLLDDPDNRRVFPSDKCVVRQVRFCGPVVLDDSLADFGGEVFTLLPLVCNIDRFGRPYSLITQAKDLQKLINKADSKIVEILASKRVFIQPGAVVDVDALREEVARPTAIIEMLIPDGVKIDQDLDLSEVFMMLVDRKKGSLKENSGLVPELRGEGVKDQAYVALEARKAQGMVRLGRHFGKSDKYRKDVAVVIAAAIRAMYRGPKVFRIVKNSVPMGWGAVNVTDPGQISDLQQGAADMGVPIKITGPIRDLEMDYEITRGPNDGTEKDATRGRLIEWAKVMSPSNPLAGMLILIKSMELDTFAGAKELARDLGVLTGLMAPQPALSPGTEAGGQDPGAQPEGAQEPAVTP